MPSGGRRPGAGRPRKAAAQKILDGNPGKRPIEVLNFDTGGLELPSDPPSYLSEKAKEIYRTVYAWLKSIGCTNGILPYNLEEHTSVQPGRICLLQSQMERVRGNEHQARSARERPEREGNAVAVCCNGAAVPETNKRGMEQDIPCRSGE